MPLQAKKTAKLYTATIVILVILLATKAGSFVADILSPSFSFVDPDNVFIWGILHHIVQALIPVIIVFVWNKNLFNNWGFIVGNKPLGIRFVGYFTLVWMFIYLGINTYNYVSDSFPEVYYDVSNSRNLLGELFFRAFIVGPSEEILFRAFAISVLLKGGFTKTIEILGFETTYAGIVAAAIFALAHIGFNIYPFEVYYLDSVQLITSLGFGLFYAIVFHTTKSILYPILIHSISDVIPVIALYVLHTLN